VSFRVYQTTTGSLAKVYLVYSLRGTGNRCHETLGGRRRRRMRGDSNERRGGALVTSIQSRRRLALLPRALRLLMIKVSTPKQRIKKPDGLVLLRLISNRKSSYRTGIRGSFTSWTAFRLINLATFVTNGSFANSNEFDARVLYIALFVLDVAKSFRSLAQQ
jgi:hypothetical protein